MTVFTKEPPAASAYLAICIVNKKYMERTLSCKPQLITRSGQNPQYLSVIDLFESLLMLHVSMTTLIASSSIDFEPGSIAAR